MGGKVASRPKTSKTSATVVKRAKLTFFPRKITCNTSQETKKAITAQPVLPDKAPTGVLQVSAVLTLAEASASMVIKPSTAEPIPPARRATATGVSDSSLGRI